MPTLFSVNKVQESSHPYKITKFIFQTEERNFTFTYTHNVFDGVVHLKLEGQDLGNTTIQRLREIAKPFKIKKGANEWNAYIQVDSEDEPILYLYDDAVKFEDLVVAPKHEILYRNGRVNDFKTGSRTKKTVYHLFQG